MFFNRKWKKADDAALAMASARGSQRAFTEIIDRYQAGVLGFARGYLNDPSLAEEICQESFLRLFQALKRKKFIAVRPYVYSIARNLCHDYFRKKKPEHLAEPPEIPYLQTPLELLKTRQGLEGLARAVDALPESQKAAILLRHTRELSYAEIAQAMDTTVSAVESLLVRARRHLKLTLTSSMDKRVE